MVAPLVVTNPCLSFGAVALQYMNSFVSCSYPDLTWSPNLSAGNCCLVSTWLSIIIARICPSHHRRPPSQLHLLRVSPSTRNDVSTTGRVRHLNRVVFANSRTKAPVYSLCSLSPIPTTTLTYPAVRDRKRFHGFADLACRRSFNPPTRFTLSCSRWRSVSTFARPCYKLPVLI
jgi:hypothetical protein